MPVWPPDAQEWAAMSPEQQQPWRDRVAMLGTQDAATWLPGSLGWRDMTDEELAAWDREAELQRMELP